MPRTTSIETIMNPNAAVFQPTTTIQDSSSTTTTSTKNQNPNPNQNSNHPIVSSSPHSTTHPHSQSHGHSSHHSHALSNSKSSHSHGHGHGHHHSHTHTNHETNPLTTTSHTHTHRNHGHNRGHNRNHTNTSTPPQRIHNNRTHTPNRNHTHQSTNNNTNNVRINQNIHKQNQIQNHSNTNTTANTNTTTTNNNSTNSTVQLPVPPLFNASNLQQWQQAAQQQQQQNNNVNVNSPSITPNASIQSPNMPTTNNATYYIQNNLQNQQLIYTQMQSLSEQRNQFQIRIQSILQPQLNELSDQMQAALFNCNHVTQPEYYQGLQNQHLLLTQNLKETQQNLSNVTYQYQWYQQLLLQYQQQQVQQHAQAQAQQQQQQAAAAAVLQQHIAIHNQSQKHNINNTVQNQNHVALLQAAAVAAAAQAQAQAQQAQAQVAQQQQIQQVQQTILSPSPNHNIMNGTTNNNNNSNNNNAILTSPHSNKLATYQQQLQQLYKGYENNNDSISNTNTNNIFQFDNPQNNAFNNKVNERMPTIKSVTKNSANSTSGNNISKQTYNKQDIFERKLCVLICKLTPDKFDRVLAKMLEFMDNNVQTQNELKIIIDKVLRFTLNQAHISSLTAKLFLHFYDYLPRLIMTQQYQQHLWDTHDIDISLTFRRILIIGLEKLFIELINNINIDKNDESEDTSMRECKNDINKRDFFALMEIIGEIYNVDLIHIRVLRKGIFDNLLPPKITNFNLIHVEALCVLFKSCGKKLDLYGQSGGGIVDKYIHKMIQLCNSDLLHGSINDKLQCTSCIAELRAIKSNNWVIHRKLGHNQKYKTINWTSIPLDEIREEIPGQEDCTSFDSSGNSSGNNSGENMGNTIYEIKEKKKKIKLNNNLTKCYGYNEELNKLIVMSEISNQSFIKCMEFGYQGSSYTLSDSGTLIVSGNNKFGQLGIENEIINMILKQWDADAHCIYKIKDISYLITSFVDSIKYKYNETTLNNILICNDIEKNDGQLISRGIASRHRFILCCNDQLYGAGCNTFNQLGFYYTNKNLNINTHTKTQNYWQKITYFVENNIKLVQIECGYTTSTFLSQDGCIYTVGYSSFGNLGLGEKKSVLNKITKIFTIKTKIQHISCGFDHTLCINEYRYVLSFGDNGFGQLGHGHLIQNRRLKPKEIEYFHKNQIHAIEICCGAFHSLVLDCNGKIYCFGYNLGYQCHYNNDDDDLNIVTPKMNDTLHNIDKITNIKCGAFHNIVETQQNQWYLWGDNRNKQCLVYDNKTQYIKIPTKYHQRDIPQNESIIDMFPGYDQTIIFTLQN